MTNKDLKVVEPILLQWVLFSPGESLRPPRLLGFARNDAPIGGHCELPPAGAADPPWMKPCPDRFPGESRGPSIRRTCRREMDPGFRRGSGQCCRAVANCVVSFRSGATKQSQSGSLSS